MRVPIFLGCCLQSIDPKRLSSKISPPKAIAGQILEMAEDSKVKSERSVTYPRVGHLAVAGPTR
eukprot:scaffold1233_cov111-Cylindrotheca_fusiformis.AAC.9